MDRLTMRTTEGMATQNCYDCKLQRDTICNYQKCRKRLVDKLAYFEDLADARNGTMKVKLEGSEKQVKWATEIREVVVECAKNDVEKAQARYNEKQNKARANKLNTAKETLEMLENETSAKFFIENFRTVLSRKQRCEKAGIESDHAAEYAFWLKNIEK